MRISTNENDPGYVFPWIAQKCKIYFNGYQRLGVITADEEQRYVVAYLFDDKGNIRTKTNNDGTKPITIVEYGDVRIEMPQDDQEIDFVVL
jgi:hypothetical protein